MVSNQFFKTAESAHPTEFGTIFPPDEQWLAKQAEEEILLPDLPIVDPHHHLWDHPGHRYLVEELTRDIQSGHNIVGTVYVEAMSAYRASGPPESRPVGETDFVVALTGDRADSAGRPAIADGIVGFADLTLGAAVEEVLQAHISAGQGRFRGVRFAGAWDESDAVQNSHAGKRPHMLAEPVVRDGIRKLAELDLTLDLWMFHPQLREVADLADTMPGLTLVLDHCGGPVGYGPYASNRDEHFRIWQSGVRELAKRPNVVCKVGGLLARGAAFDYVTAELPPTSEQLARIWRPWLETCITAFGPERSMFESNFPVEKMGTGYATIWNTFKRVTAGASPAELSSMYSGTARRVYRLPG